MLFYNPKIILQYLLLVLLITVSTLVTAQSIQGKILDEQNQGLPVATIILSKGNDSLVTTTDTEGFYQFNSLSLGTWILKVQYLGYNKIQEPVIVSEPKVYTISQQLTPEAISIKELSVTGKSEHTRVQRSGYAVDLITVKAFQNSTMDLNQLIQKAPGVHIRSVGGLGSAFDLSLNGLSGNRIRYFLDGVPMEDLGSALNLNNFPINLIRRVEVFKGAVPIELSADALGGAINLVTGYKSKSFIDASYSIGSFNTHRVALNGQYSNLPKGFYIRLNGFFNYSDNNYWMYDMPVYDELGNNTGTNTIQRFHDQYSAGMLKIQFGLLDKKFADELSLSVTGALNRKNYQQPDNNIKRTFGYLHSLGNTLSAFLIYKKNIGKLDINAYSQWSMVNETVVDTSHQKFNWAGSAWFRDPSSARGELNERKSIFTLADKRINSSIQLRYRIHPQHQLNLAISQNFVHRQGRDAVDKLRQSFITPAYMHKNIAGLSYKFKTKNERFEAAAFGKGYWFNAFMITQNYSNENVETSINQWFAGYGLWATYHITTIGQIKLSYEKAYRIPEPHELLGDGIYIRPSTSLQPENSHNVNLGYYGQHQLSKWKFNYSINGFYRNAHDYIRFAPLGPFGTFENVNNVGVIGAETGITLSYKNLLSLSANTTYQHLTDETAFDQGLANTNYKSRLPNIPYWFANLRLGYTPKLKWEQLRLGFYWSARYVHQFYLTWEKLGSTDSKNIIPTQFIQDLDIECSILDGRYNLALTINNFTNSRAYDNFNIQKPGIACYVKFRCFFLK